MLRISPETRVRLDEQRAYEVVQTVLDAYLKRELIFADPKTTPPEESAFPKFREFEEKHQVPDFALHAVFFITNNLYADNTSRQLRRISNENTLKTFSALFDPNKIAEADNQDQVIYDVLDFLRPARYHGMRTAQNWRHNALVLARDFEGSVRNFFATLDFDAEKILPVLQGPEKKKDWKLFKGFGPKTARLALQYIGQYNLAPLKNLDKIGIPVDFLIARIMIGTGAIQLVDGKAHKKWVLDKTLVPLFIRMCNEHNLPPQKVSEALWMLGHFGCNRLRHTQCPVANICTTLVPRLPIDEEGLFVLPKPEDDLRWKTNRNR